MSFLFSIRSGSLNTNYNETVKNNITNGICNNTGQYSEEMEIVDHKIYYPTMTIVLALVTLAFLIGTIIKRRHFHYFPETAATVAIGILSGFILLAYFQSLHEEHGDDGIKLKANFFYLVLLPPIIFEAGYAMKRVNFFKNFTSIMSLAFLGTILSAVITGLVIYMGTLAKLYSVDLLQCLVYGALISATDPVSVLATLQEVPIDKNLYILIFGESALNDAVALILFKLLLRFLEEGVDPDAGSAAIAILQAVGVFVGSCVLGYVIGMISAKIIKEARFGPDEHATEVSIVFILAYLSYIVADWIELSGIVSILFCGMAQAHYTIDNLSEEALRLSKGSLRVYAYLAENIIFIYLGLGLPAFDKSVDYNPAFIAIAILAILISRVHVFVLMGISNIWRKVPVTINQMKFLWYAGLRGALCFVMALELAENKNLKDLNFGKLVLATTLVTDVFTIIVQGAFTTTVLERLNLKLTPEQIREQEAADLLAIERKKTGVHAPSFDTDDEIAMEEDSQGTGSSILKPLKRLMRFVARGFRGIKKLDKKYLKPFLTNTRYGETRLEAKLEDIGRSSFKGISGFDDDLKSAQAAVGSNDANMESIQLVGFNSPKSKTMANDLDY